MLYFQFLFLFTFSTLFSQTVIIDEMEYKRILWGEDEEFNEDEFTKGSFFKNENDLVICKGRMWKGNPPKSTTPFSYRDNVIENIGEFNNRAVELLERKELGDWSEANQMLNAMISFDPMFFPARYNYGRFLYMQKSFQEASYEFNQAKNIIPEYYRNYFYLGLISIFLGNKQEAEGFLKQAASLNSLNNEANIYLAEIYWKEGLITRSKEIIKEAEKVNNNTEALIIRRQKPAFPVLDVARESKNPNENPNAKIAEGMLLFHQEKYFLAYKVFKTIDTETLNKNKIPYLKKMHYFFAESANKILDPKTAASQYSEILKYPFDPFFQEISANTIVRKQNIAASTK